MVPWARGAGWRAGGGKTGWRREFCGVVASICPRLPGCMCSEGARTPYTEGLGYSFDVQECRQRGGRRNCRKSALWIGHHPGKAVRGVDRWAGGRLDRSVTGIVQIYSNDWKNLLVAWIIQIDEDINQSV